MNDEAAFTWDQPRPPSPPPAKRQARAKRSVEAPIAPGVGERIPLREAERRFGVSVAKLRSWARSGAVDAVMGTGPHGRQWFVTPESIAHHLGEGRRAESKTSPKTAETPDGSSMLVPRDAWDKLMDQLGNLHEAGLRLAEARERAAKAETESVFLRERLSEMRSERDALIATQDVASAAPPSRSAASPGWATALRRSYDRLLGRKP